MAKNTEYKYKTYDGTISDYLLRVIADGELQKLTFHPLSSEWLVTLAGMEKEFKTSLKGLTHMHSQLASFFPKPGKMIQYAEKNALRYELERRRILSNLSTEVQAVLKASSNTIKHLESVMQELIELSSLGLEKSSTQENSDSQQDLSSTGQTPKSKKAGTSRTPRKSATTQSSTSQQAS